MDKVLPVIARIHTPLLHGEPLMLLPARLLVRWPRWMPVPAIGERFSGLALAVPDHLFDAVITLLCGSALARCDAAMRIAQEPNGRKRILLRVYSRPYVQGLLAGARRIQPELRQQIEAVGGVPIRRLTKAAYAPTLARQIRRAKV